MGGYHYGAKFFRSWIGTVCLITWIVFVGFLFNQHKTTTFAMAAMEPNHESGSSAAISVANKINNSHLHMKKSAFSFSVSKRRVPNGPDPIHNRKARNTREPPGRN
ncbi:CLAVATA3/ESR (CLE)-related protein 25 [Impatiens glandulifera]|uniref:CLAVATA3/ESR (CLE)-related protein 25 n=1 Tax=Impatiens glandulifera TaxID=253017 RepID=UPI001FB1075B|nr:CLAVATA3/ESR (CLE)-related protein 25 [Impatiens glandulifera]